MCVFVPGRPFALQNCSVSNQSADSLHIECIEGFDGGLPQMFLLELVEVPVLRLVRNLSLQVCDLFPPSIKHSLEASWLYTGFGVGCITQTSGWCSKLATKSIRLHSLLRNKPPSRPLSLASAMPPIPSHTHTHTQLSLSIVSLTFSARVSKNLIFISLHLQRVQALSVVSRSCRGFQCCQPVIRGTAPPRAGKGASIYAVFCQGGS